ncbi:MAG TPA: WYL domain-containing protein, partial [Conexibacter sp.]|nr:WYL domain-containing protein [Conexibacter sp.]
VVDSRRRGLLPTSAAQAPREARCADGRLELEIWFERIEHAQVLLGLGAAVEVLAPPQLRASLAAHAAELAALYRPALEHTSRG